MIRRRHYFLAIVFTLLSLSLTKAQSVTGSLVYEVTRKPAVGANVSLEGTYYEAVTNAQGIFRLYDVPQGDYELIVVHEWDQSSLGTVTVGEATTDMGQLEIVKPKKSVDKIEIGVITLDDDALDNDDNGTGISSLLTASRDPFVTAAAFNLSVGRFRQRGYGNEDQAMYLNGMPVNDLDDGRVGWNTWGGLNDVLRVQEVYNDLDASTFSFGGMLGSRNIDLSASSQRPQTKFVYTFANRSYQHRTMLTHSSGEQANGWAYTLSASRRWGDSGYTPGTFYDSYSYALLVDKKINDKHLLNFAVLGSPTTRGRNGVSTQEVYDLAGSNYYNPNWGYQNGEVRNSRVSDFHQPYFMLRHDWNVSKNVEIKTTAAYHTGYFSNSRLDWFDAPDPRPDYYRKLPSYQLTEELQTSLAGYFQENPDQLQVDFDEMYRINGNSFREFENANGSGETFSGNFSRYIIEAQHFDNEKFSFNSFFNAYLNSSVTLTGGITYLAETSNQYRRIEDLLGGEFYIDLDRFAERDFPDDPDVAQSNLLTPNRILMEDDRFGWDFDINTSRASAWAQANIATKIFDFFVAVEGSNTSSHRFGYYQNGRFPDNSLGKSPVNSFTNGAVKGGITYKIDGRNYLYGRGSYRTRAPFSRNIFLSARTRDETVAEEDLKSETIFGGEVGYVFRFPGVKGRITGFYTEFQDQLRSTNIYFDASNSFGNYLLTGLGRKHQGIEFGAEIKLTSTISATTALAVNAFQYNSRPSSVFTADNEALNPELPAPEANVIYLQNYYLPGTQNAGSLTLEYRSPKFWFVNISGNYFNNINLDLFPERRTDAAVEGIVVPAFEDLRSEIIDQYELDDQFVLNLFAGKSWRIKKYTLMINASVNNILNNQQFVTGGFEQFRYREREPGYFPERLFYAWGTNYSLGLTLRY